MVKVLSSAFQVAVVSKTSDIGTVSEFGLRITADNLVFLCLFEKQLVLFWSSLFAEGDEEHAGVQAVGSRLADEARLQSQIHPWTSCVGPGAVAVSFLWPKQLLSLHFSL